MATTHFKGSPLNTVGNLPNKGSKVPNFSLTRQDLSLANRETYAGKRIVFNVFPSIDTPTCALSVKKFNELASSLPSTVVLNISMDLPFAQKRFCAAEGINNVELLSAFRSSFGQDFGVSLQDSALAGLFARAVIIADADGKVIYTELANELSLEPNYEAALAALKEKTGGCCGCC